MSRGARCFFSRFKEFDGSSNSSSSKTLGRQRKPLKSDGYDSNIETSRPVSLNPKHYFLISLCNNKAIHVFTELFLYANSSSRFIARFPVALGSMTGVFLRLSNVSVLSFTRYR